MGDYAGPVCRHVCPVCGGCEICCVRDHCKDDDQDGEGAHWLQPGETCPLTEPRDTDG